jgi:hypothetical protein
MENLKRRLQATGFRLQGKIPDACCLMPEAFSHIRQDFL